MKDDHRIFSDSLASLINDFEGFSVCWSVQDGKTGIHLLQQNQRLPDIVLLDIIMPGINGLEVAKWIFENKNSDSMMVSAKAVGENTKQRRGWINCFY